MKIKAVNIFSTKGRRQAQEDYVIADEKKGIFVVADGFGGPSSGSYASSQACELIFNFLGREAGDDEATFPYIMRSYNSLAANVLFNSVLYANQRLLYFNKNKNVHSKGGASVIAGFLDGDFFALANVGSVRSWVFRNGRSTPLTLPKSYSQLEDPTLNSQEGYIDIKGFLDIPLMALGLAKDLEPEIVEFKIKPGDWVMLHTDGVHKGVLRQIMDTQKENLGSQRSSQKIQKIIEDSKYEDNASAVVLIV